MTQTSTDLQAVAAALREHDRFLVVTHENPDGDALGSLLATTLALRAARQGRRDVSRAAADRSRASTRSCSSTAFGASLPADLEQRVLVAVDCAKADRIGPDPEPIERASLVIDIDHHHDNTPVRRRQPDRRGRVVDRGGAPRRLPRARCRADARARRAALHRARHRHRPLPVHEHDPEGAAARRRARRGGRRRARGLPAGLRVASSSRSSSCSPERSTVRGCSRAG